MGLYMDAPPTPAVPDPKATAAAQTSGDVQSAVANAWLQNANVNTPLGSSATTQSGSHTIKDAEGKDIEVPSFTQTQTLSPSQQTLFDQQNKIGSDMNTLADSQIGRLSNTLNTPFSTSGLPSAVNSIGSGPDLRGAAVSGVNLDTNAPTTFGNTAGGIQYNVGSNDFSKDRDRVEGALFDRLNTQLDRDRGATEARLANQGIVSGSEAYRTEQDQMGRTSNDARMAAIINAGQEQSRLFGMDVDRGNFNNQAQQQDFGQQQARGLFGLQGAAQNNAAILDASTFANTARAQNDNAAQQMFGNQATGATFANTARERAMQEMLMERNQPINEISTLMNGGQVTMPQFTQFQGGSIAPSSIGQNTYASAGLLNDQWKTQSQFAAANNAGIFGLGSAALGAGGKIGAAAVMSDRRLKKDIVRIGKHNGLPVYSFIYAWGQPSVGFMADEVERVMPEAVSEIGGFKAVDYDMVLEAA